MLTDCGFLFYDEIVALAESGTAVKYACYDVTSKQMVYRTGKLKHAFTPADEALVEMTQSTEARNWNSESGDYGVKQEADEDDRSNHLSLLVTKEHDMYVQLGRASQGAYEKLSWRQDKTHSSGFAPPSKFPASALLPDSPADALPQKGSKRPYTHARFVCVAEEGIGESEPERVLNELRKDLGLTNEAQVHSFIELYGFWLGDGTLRVKGHSIHFIQRKETDIRWLVDMCSACGLVEKDDWTRTWNQSIKCWDIRITNRRWWDFFNALYGSKYGHSVASKRRAIADEAEEKGRSASNEDEDEVMEIVDASSAAFSSVSDTMRTKKELFTRSVKWFAPWVSYCDKQQLRTLIRGLWRADGAWAHQKKTLFTSSVAFRDAIMTLLLHAGYSAFFSLGYRAGTDRGTGENGCTITATRDAWVIKFAEPTSSSGTTTSMPNIARADIKSVPYSGKVWCVTADHKDHLIIAQRAHRVDGITTKASRPTIIGQCCLVEIFPSRCDSKEDFLRTIKFAYLYAKTVTLGATHWPETNRVMLRNRRIGTSVSGVAQFLAKYDLETLREWLDDGYKTIEYWDEVYHDWFCIPKSIKTTSIKPSGSVSLLAGSTPGVHYPESRFYIRRVRFATMDPLLGVLKKAGYYVELLEDSQKSLDKVKDEKEREAVYNSSTSVVEIPVDAGEGVRVQSQVSMWEQLSLAAFMQKWWADNQVSCTVTFNPDTEGDHIANALNYFQYQLKGISFLPKLAKGAYKQMPYEEITEEVYMTKFRKLKPVHFETVTTMAKDFEPERFCDGDTCLVPPTTIVPEN